MSARNWGNPPLLSTTAGTQNDPSTATLCAELIIPVIGDTTVQDYYEVRFGLGASTGALWRLDCALSSGLGSSALRNNSYGTPQRVNLYTGSNLSGEFVITLRAAPGDRFRATVESTFTGSVAAWIQAEALT
jgi:hypothetical protein